MKSAIIRQRFTTLRISAILCAMLANARAGTPQSEVIETPPPSSGWEFRAEPYGWLIGINGTIGVGGLTTEMSQSFSDVFSALDMAAALQFEARHGRWGFILDGFYGDLSDSGSPPGPLYSSVGVEFQQFLGEAEVAYRVWESPKGFVDVYGGIRYTGLSVDLSTRIDKAGIETASQTASARIVERVGERANAIVEPEIDEFKTATAAKRTEIEAKVTDAVLAAARNRAKQELRKQIADIRQGVPRDLVRLDFDRISRAVKKEHAALAKSTADLKVAELRASVDATRQNAVAMAQARVDKARENLARAINRKLTDSLPVSVSDNKNWVDPIVGVRSQWNINEKWFLAAKGDVGGFGVSSDFMWSLQTTVGYNFTNNVSAELGFRYLDTDYKDGGFTYDLDQSGIYTGLNIRF